jgi:hypothetical protein
MLKENEFEGYHDDKPQAEKNSTNTKPVREGQPMGGQNFGRNGNTPAGDDKNNPSQNAGYSNAYFSRTEPSEEHPEDSNFKAAYQEGEPDYNSAQPYAQGQNKQTDNNRPNLNSSYREGTADDESAEHDTFRPGDFSE